MKDPTPEELEGHFKLEDGKLLRFWGGVFWKEIASVPNHKSNFVKGLEKGALCS